jgi:DNA mismatch repair protein MutL
MTLPAEIQNETVQNETEGNEIRLLPDEVINQISAGEVIERPASVVRELLDNSVDAGATEIVIDIEEGGRRLIRVSDNGKGLKREDLVLAFQNHATSKLRDAKDLSAINTFGFRGEALSSIAAISRVEMKSRHRNSNSGDQIKIEGGKILGIEPAARSVGTEVVCRALFFNTPARRKFLKSGTTEEAKIKGWVIQSAIPNYKVAYKLSFDNKVVLSLPAVNSLLERAQSFLRGAIFEVGHSHNGIRVSGLVGHPGSASSRASNLVIVVNKRVIKDAQIVKGIREGFSSMLKGPEIPIGIISIELPPSQVDVNVHPQKSEVRFVNSGEIFVAVRDGVSKAIGLVSAPISTIQETATPSVNSPITTGSPTISYGLGSFSKISTPVPTQFAYQNPLNFIASARVEANQINLCEPFKYSELRFIGQLMKCYLLCEYRGEFVVVDMHAAHERINYNKIRDQFRSKRVQEQRLLTPVVVTLNPEQHQNLKSSFEALRGWGFDIEEFGEGEVIVRSTPVFIPTEAVPEIITALAEESEQALIGKAVDAEIDRIAARLACHGSIRSGRILTTDEAYALFKDLDAAEIAGACPHGRPVAARFRESDIEKWFGRDR